MIIAFGRKTDCWLTTAGSPRSRQILTIK